jgi:hypothetical protein
MSIHMKIFRIIVTVLSFRLMHMTQAFMGTSIASTFRDGNSFSSSLRWADHDEFISSYDEMNDSLTKEELLLRLSEVRKYYRDNPEKNLSQKDVCLRLLSTRFPDLMLNRCYIANSTIPSAGFGVFAKRDINDGELITLYPGDAVLMDNHKDNDDAVMSVMFGSHIKQEDRNFDRVTTSFARGYEMEINDNTSIIGDPNLGDYAAYLGHFINDGASLDCFDQKSREAYLKETLSKFNAAVLVFEGAHMGAVATKKILKGEEVFLSYGEGYWLSRLDTGYTPEREAVLKNIKAKMTQRRASNVPSVIRVIDKVDQPKGFNKASKSAKSKGFGRVR